MLSRISIFSCLIKFGRIAELPSPPPPSLNEDAKSRLSIASPMLLLLLLLINDDVCECEDNDVAGGELRGGMGVLLVMLVGEFGGDVIGNGGGMVGAGLTYRVLRLSAGSSFNRLSVLCIRSDNDDDGANS